MILSRFQFLSTTYLRSESRPPFFLRRRSHIGDQTLQRVGLRKIPHVDPAVEREPKPLVRDGRYSTRCDLAHFCDYVFERDLPLPKVTVIMAVHHRGFVSRYGFPVTDAYITFRVCSCCAGLNC